MGVVRVRWPILKFNTPEISLERLKIQSSNFVVVGYIECSDDRPSLKKAWPGSCDIFQNFTPSNFSEMAEDRIVKFCARVNARSFSLVIITNCPSGGRG